MNEMVTITREEYEQLKSAAEDAADLAELVAFRKRMDDGEEEVVEASYVRRMLDGESPVRVWRDIRGLSQVALSEKSGVNRVQITNIESGKNAGSVTTVKKLATALGVKVDELV